MTFDVRPLQALRVYGAINDHNAEADNQERPGELAMRVPPREPSLDATALAAVPGVDHPVSDPPWRVERWACRIVSWIALSSRESLIPTASSTRGARRGTSPAGLPLTSRAVETVSL